MARIIDNQINPWGKQQGPELQRSDLWVIDFNQALTGLARAANSSDLMTSGLDTPFLPTKLATYFAKSVALPDLKIRSEPIRRDARPYPMPSWDEPLEPVRIVFWLDAFGPGHTGVDPFRSDIYQMLNVWRAVVRAGRGSMSSEFAITLNGNYSIDYAFDVRVLMMRASSRPTLNSALNTTNEQAVMNDLEYSLQLRMVNCWLGAFRVSELDYEGAKIVQLDTTFYAEDIRQESQNNL